MNFSSFSYSVAEVIGGLAILKFRDGAGKTVGYTVGQGGLSFLTLAAARKYARRFGLR